LHLCGVVETNKPGSSTEIKIIYQHVHLKMIGTKLKSMNALRNKVQLIGNLCNAPEIRNTESGKKWFVSL
jgi:hypothetical protein